MSISELVTSYINKAFVYSKESSTTYIENDLISLISKIDITEWKKTENEKFTLVLRDLLTCIRCLRMTKDSLSHTRKFLLALEALLEHGDLASITQIPILLFRSRVEQIQSGNKLTNLNQFEAHLFELKDDLNLINSIMGQLSNKKPTARSINI